MPGAELGVIVRGSLTDGLEMRLSESRSVEELRAGRYVIVEGKNYRYITMLTDVNLEASTSDLLLRPPQDEFRRQVLLGSMAYATAQLRPMLMVPKSVGDGAEPEPVKTVPAHFSAALEATPKDVESIFGSDMLPGHFTIGAPVDMLDTPVCLNLDRFVERSNGVFGKSGTGKTFLTRLCLCGLIQKSSAVNLVFDMHSEYGWQGSHEDANRTTVRGLKQYFGKQVLVYTLDPESSQARRVPVEFPVRIPQSMISVEDVILLQRELNLNPTAAETAYLLEQTFGEQNWLRELLKVKSDAPKDLAERIGAHAASLGALKRKLSMLIQRCRGFLLEDVRQEDDAVPAIMSALSCGKHVILEFGRYNQPIQYMLVANILTRRIHEEYVRQTEKAQGGGSGSVRPLVITVEEAHKFLSPSLADQTIFGTIAREMRKYHVTLLVVDQRPSGIDDEVLSQIGTRMVCQMDDEKDVSAVLSGLPGSTGLRSVLASLDSKQQALLLGHAVPMPVVIRTRTYDDEAFRKAMLPEDEATRNARTKSEIDEDF